MDYTQMKQEDFINALTEIKIKMVHGLSYNEAKVEAKPIIDEMNRRVEIIAKQYKQHPVKFSFAGLMR